LIRILGILGYLLVSLPATAGQNMLTPMLGITHWKEETNHTARGSVLSFVEGNRPTAGIRYLYLFDSGLAVGGDIYWYKKDVVTTTQANEVSVVHTHALVEYFFYPDESVSPFVGGGAGLTTLVFTGGNLDGDRTSGLSFEVNGGVLFHFSEHVGVQFEYKLSQFNLNDNIDGLDAKIDSTASSVMAGLTISF
jgi:opacity protein-like surface antigen